MARLPFNWLWASNPAPDQFEEPPQSTQQSGWVGGAQGQLPEAKWENYWHHRVDAALQQIERDGAMEWHAEAEYRKGGYAALNGKIYRSIGSGNVGNNPSADSGDNWEEAPVRAATADEAQALESLTKILTPGRLADAFRGENQYLPGDGFQVFPGGLIIQWLGANRPEGGEVNTYYQKNFPIAFPNRCLAIVATSYSTVSNKTYPVLVNDIDNVVFQIAWGAGSEGGVAANSRVICIGY